MSKLKKHSLLVIIAMLFLFLIPMSFAADIDDLQSQDVDEMVVEDTLQSVDNNVLSSSDDSDILTATALTISVDNNEISMDEGGSASISGKLTYNLGYSTYSDNDAKIICKYTDANGVSQTESVITNKGTFSFDLSKFTDLTAEKSPYILTLTGEDYTGYLDWAGYNIPGSTTVTVTVNSGSSNSGETNMEDTPKLDITYPTYDTFTTTSTVYVTQDGKEGSYTSIADAVTNAGDNTEIIIKSGTYSVVNVKLNKNLKFTGDGEVILNAGNSNNHFEMGGNYIAEFNNLKFINGKSSSTSTGSSIHSAYGKESTINIINCTFENNNGGPVFYMYSSTNTIIQSNFISNAAPSNLFTFSADKTKINFCNFIKNTHGSSNYIIGQKVDAKYNFWGSNSPTKGSAGNDAGSSTDISYYIVINPVAANDIAVGDNTIPIKFQVTDGTTVYNFDPSMADLTVNLQTLKGTLDPTSVTISNNIGNVKYSLDETGSDTLYVKLNGNVISKLEFEVTENTAPKEIKINFNGAEGYADGSISVPVNVTINGELAGNIEISYTFNGATNQLTLTDGKGNIELTLPDAADDYNLTVSYDGVEVNKTVAVKVIPTSLEASDVDVYVNNQGALTAKLTDNEGNPVEGVSVSFDFGNGNVLTNTTGADGIATVNLALDVNTYNVNIKSEKTSKYDEASKGVTVLIKPYEIAINFDDKQGVTGGSISVPVNVTLNDDLIGDETITYKFNNGESQTIALTSGKVNIDLNLPETAGEYGLTVYYGDKEVTKIINVIYYYGGIIYVSNTGNNENEGSTNAPVATISKAIELASNENNKYHKIIIREGSYSEHDLNISAPLDISGEGNVVIDANNNGRILNIKSDANISGITFKNGKAEDGGAIYISSGKVIIDNSKFFNNNGTTWGGAIYWNAANGVLTNSIFEENAARNGAAIHWVSNNGYVENCTFNNNDNIYVTAGSIGISVWGSEFTVKNSNFTNNHGKSNSDHGALYLYGDDATVDNCLFENNTMDVAAALQSEGENVKIINSRFINNTVYNGVGRRSGAIEIQNTGEISNNVFIGNGGENCSYGGAINIVFANYYGGEITIFNNKFINNSARYGGAIFVDSGANDWTPFSSLTISQNNFENNFALEGSGIYIDNNENTIEISSNEFKTDESLGEPIYIDEYAEGDIEQSGNTILTIAGIKITTNNPSLGENAIITVTLPEKATGNITVYIGSQNKTSKLENGAATVIFTDLTLGEHSIKVEYEGDNNYVSNSNISSLTVSKVDVPVDNALDITIPSNTNSPSFSINLPNDATGNLTVTVDGKNYTVPLVNGSATVNVPNLSYGNHNIVLSYTGDDKYDPIIKSTSINIPEPFISGNKDISMLYSAGTKYKVRVTLDGNAVVGEYVTFNFNGVNKKIKTDKNGYATYTIPTVKPKKYTISATYKGKTVKNTVKVNSIVKATNKKVKKSKKVTKVKVTLKKVNGKYLKSKTIKIKFNKKTYKVKTNKKGVATWKVKKSMLKKLKVGKKYKYTVTYGKDVVTKKLTIKR